jgi:formylglycine-generating enzyme required for sulfatase activity
VKKALRDEIDRLKAELAATKRATREASVQTSGAAPEWSTASTLTKLLPRIPALRFPEALQRRRWQVLGGICGAVILGAAAWQYVQSPLRGLQAGDVFQDCDLCPEMVVVPAGSFLMGSPEGEGAEDERPQHEVSIARPFAVGKYEVTFDEWEACLAAGGCDHSPDDVGWGAANAP